MDMKYAVMAVRTKADKQSIKHLAYQVAKITTKCVNPNIKIVDCIVTFGGTKDIIREVRRLSSKKEFQYVLIYSPMDIAQSKEDYEKFVNCIREDYHMEVVTYKEDLS